MIVLFSGYKDVYSNFNKEFKLKIGNHTLCCVEQAYMYAKGIYFKDYDAVRSMLKESNPKKIKELVSKTQTQSSEGIDITKNMKENFISVVENVSNTLELVNSVATEAEMEMNKIESINTLIKDIDKMTNQNKDIMQSTYVVTYDLSEISNSLYEQVQNKKFVSDSNGRD